MHLLALPCLVDDQMMERLRLLPKIMHLCGKIAYLPSLCSCKGHRLEFFFQGLELLHELFFLLKGHAAGLNGSLYPVHLGLDEFGALPEQFPIDRMILYLGSHGHELLVRGISLDLEVLDVFSQGIAL